MTTITQEWFHAPDREDCVTAGTVDDAAWHQVSLLPGPLMAEIVTSIPLRLYRGPVEPRDLADSIYIAAEVALQLEVTANDRAVWISRQPSTGTAEWSIRYWLRYPFQGVTQEPGDVQVRLRGDNVQFTTVPAVPDGYQLSSRFVEGSILVSPYDPSDLRVSLIPAFMGGVAQGDSAGLTNPGYGYVVIVRSPLIARNTAFVDTDGYVQKYVIFTEDTVVSPAPAGSIGVPSAAGLSFALGAPPAGVETVLLGAHYNLGSVPDVLGDTRTVNYYHTGFAPTVDGRYDWMHNDLAAPGFGYRYYVQYLDIHGRGSAVVDLGTKDP